jgi:hypothetical protein
MTKEEFGKIAAYMRGAYSGKNFLPDKASVAVWYEEMKDLDAETLFLAVKKYTATSRFPPSIAELREAAAEITHGEIPAWADGWEEVRHAMRFYGSYRPEEALQSMTPITRRAVERLGFTELCASENEAVDRANFRMIYEQIAERSKKSDQISAAIRERIEATQGDKYTAIAETPTPKIEERHEGVPMPESARKALARLGL